jgi:hypothetical protein
LFIPKIPVKATKAHRLKMGRLPGYVAQPFLPARARKGIELPEWYFHTILLHEGQIYDFDYDQKGLPVPYLKYFKKMFKVKTKSQSNWLSKLSDLTDFESEKKRRLNVVVISALDYLKEYEPKKNLRQLPIDGNGNWEFWLKEYDDKEKNLEDYLNEIEASETAPE